LYGKGSWEEEEEEGRQLLVRRSASVERLLFLCFPYLNAIQPCLLMLRSGHCYVASLGDTHFGCCCGKCFTVVVVVVVIMTILAAWMLGEILWARLMWSGWGSEWWHVPDDRENTTWGQRHA
jgi:hypothetical protein